MKGDIPGIFLPGPGADPAVKLNDTVRKRKLVASLSDLELRIAAIQ